MDQIPINPGNNLPLPANLGVKTDPPVISQPVPQTSSLSPNTSTSNPVLAKVLLGIIPLLIFTATGIISYSIVNNKNQQVTYQSSAKEISQTGIASQSLIPAFNDKFDQIANDTLSWIDKQKDENGVYAANVLCENGKCEKSIGSHLAGAQVAWARFKHYEKTRNPADVSAIEKDITTYLNPSLVPNIQNKFWSCKLLFEMKNSSLPEISSMQDKFAALCQRNIYNPIFLNEAKTTVESSFDKEPDLTLIGANKPDPAISQKQNEYQEVTVLSSEYTTRFLWFSDPKNLRIAKQLFIKAASYYDSQNKNTNGNDSILAEASLDIFKATNDAKYKQFAVDILAKNESDECLKIFNCTTTAILAKDLNQIEPKDQFKKIANDFLNQAIDKGYDDTDFKGFFKGLKSFHDFSLENQIAYTIKNNFLLVSLLSQE